MTNEIEVISRTAGEPGVVLKSDKTNSLMLLLMVAVMLLPLNAIGQPEKEIWKKNHAESFLNGGHDDPPMILRNGGPDSYGYFFIDSDDLAFNAPDFRWVNIVNVGTQIPLDEDDEVLGPYSLGFSFNFYGQFYTGIRICSNGWISFTSLSAEHLNRPIPTADEPNNLLAVFWDDLLPDSGRAYHYSNNFDTCIVAWHNFGRYSGQGRYTFEIIITADGNLLFQYLFVGGILDSYTIGIENGSGTVGLQYLHNAQQNMSGKAVYFGLRPPRIASHDVLPTSIRSPEAIGVSGDSVFPNVFFFNNGVYTENFDGRVRVERGTEIYERSVRINALVPSSGTFVGFPLFVPSEPGAYLFLAMSALGTDQVPSNDTIQMQYTVYSDIYRNGFESPDSDFAGDNDWQRGIPTVGPLHAHSGQNVWGTKLDDYYTNGPLLSTLISNPIVIDSGAVMTFWHWYNIEALFDGGNVKITTDGGATWEILTPTGGYDGQISDVFHNPIGGQPGFYGFSGDWILETFDLSSYAHSAARFRFDFGADFTTVAQGWYIDDFSIYGGQAALPGWLAGVVTDSSSHEPIPGADISAGPIHDSTDVGGVYLLELVPGRYAVVATAQFHNSVTVEDVIISSGDTVMQNFSLPSPSIQVDTAAIDTSVMQGQVISIIRQIANAGTGALDFEVEVHQREMPIQAGRDSYSAVLTGKLDDSSPELLDFGDELFTFDPQTPTGDISCVGVEFDGNYFWITGRHSSDDIHKLYKFDSQGSLLASFNQNTVSDWGWRDLAWDGIFLYASDENELAQIDPLTGLRIDTIPMPQTIPPPVRALAYDPATDRFWGANYSSNIIEFDRAGQTIRSFPNDHHIFGLAWDGASPDGPWLWVFSQDGDPMIQISQYDPRQGFFTGLAFYAADHNGGITDLASGACFTSEWDFSRGVLFCLVMGRTTIFDSFDLVQGYEITTLPQWLSVEPRSGIIPPGGSLDLIINLDFEDSTLAPDSLYLGSVTIRNNGSETPMIHVAAGLRSATESDGEDLPSAFDLYRNYPNPFNAATRISFIIPDRSRVSIEVFNILGQKIATLVDGEFPAGRHNLTWKPDQLVSGYYFCRLSAGHNSKIGRMILVK